MPLVPHAGSWQQAGIAGEARLFNQPLRRVASGSGSGRAFAAVESGELILDTIKRAEDADALVLRLYEPHGASGTSRLRLELPFESARYANALEETLGESEVAVEDGALIVPYRPFELITLLVD